MLVLKVDPKIHEIVRVLTLSSYNGENFELHSLFRTEGGHLGHGKARPIPLQSVEVGSS